MDQILGARGIDVDLPISRNPINQREFMGNKGPMMRRRQAHINLAGGTGGGNLLDETFAQDVDGQLSPVLEV